MKHEDECVFHVHMSNFKKLSEYIWIGDSGASSHMANNTLGMCDLEAVKGGVTIGDGSGIKITRIGKMDVIIIQRNGTKTEKTLTDVKVVPRLRNSLFSLTKVMMNG